MTKYGELHVISGEGLGAQRPLLLHDQITVGRGVEADFRLTDPSMSREQFMICVGRAHCLVQEMGSKNGTFINGQRLAGTQVLHHQDRIRVGRHELQIELFSIEDQHLCCAVCGGVIDTVLEDMAFIDPTKPICLVCQYLDSPEEDRAFEVLLEAGEPGQGLPSTLHQVGPYKLAGRLGRGAASVVYKAFDPRVERFVALKLLRPREEKRGRFERFLCEARLIASLHHPAIVRCYDLGHAEGLVYMALEYVEGHDLGQLMRVSGAQGLRPALDWTLQLAGALIYAHEKGVIHRDLKLGNLLLDRRGRIKVIDFGIARALDLSGTLKRHAENLLGTPQYMAPEQIKNAQRVDHRVDVFAAGVILYRLIAGCSPYSSCESTAQLLRERLAGKSVPITEHCPDLAPALVELIETTMAHDPADRYQDARELARALQRAMRDADRPPSVAVPVLTPRPLMPGDVISGTVEQVEAFGAFLVNEKARVFVGLNQWTWLPRQEQYDELAEQGRDYKVKLISWVEASGHWVGSIKSAYPEKNPWHESSICVVGAKDEGFVVEVLPWGAFLELGSGALAVVLSEDLTVQLAQGQRLRIEILQVEPETQRIRVRPA